MNKDGHALFPIFGKTTTTRLATRRRKQGLDRDNTISTRKSIFESKKSLTNPEITLGTLRRERSEIEDPADLIARAENRGFRREGSTVHISKANIQLDKQGNIKSSSEFQYDRSVSDMTEIMSNKTRMKLGSSSSRLSSARESYGRLQDSVPKSTTTGTGSNPGMRGRQHSTLGSDGTLEVKT